MKIFVRPLLNIIFTFSLGSSVFGQDFHYTQFYSAPLNLNPAFTGAMETTRIGANYRKQWPGLGFDFNATSIYFDTYFYESNFNIGFAANKFEESLLNIRNIDAALFLGYKLDMGDGYSFRFGGQFGVVNRSLTLQELVYGDQIDLLTRSINPGSMDMLPVEDSKWYPDISFGALFQTPDYWLGVSSHHVTRPKIGYLENQINRLPLKWSIHGGVLWDLDNRTMKYYPAKKTLSLSFNYKRQAAFQQIEFIPQVQVDKFIGGIGFRNIHRFNELPDQNSINALLGFNVTEEIIKSFDMIIGYSYDYMLNRFSQPAHVSHEISLIFAKKSYLQTILPCLQDKQKSNWRY
ncbi:MAG: PorP/SprF family type IX secretion system membrane protein [Cyclobacteriaceae bacterium]